MSFDCLCCHRNFLALALLPVLCPGCEGEPGLAEEVGASVAASSVRSRPVVIDGRFDDWADVEPAVDDTGDALGVEVDIGIVGVRHDGEYVHCLIGLNRELNVQRLDGSMKILLDVDGRVDTGVDRHGMPGVDVVIRFSAADPKRPRRSGMGVGIEATMHRPAPATASGGGSGGESDGEPVRVGHADLGFVLAPTCASATVECRMERRASLPDTPELFGGKSFGIKLVSLAADGRVTDETDTIFHALTPVVAGAELEPAHAHDDLPSRLGGALRVMTWNVEFGTLLKKPAVFARILNLLDPDVILLQEMTAKDSGDAIAAFLESRLPRPGESWSVLFGEGGGHLRSAVASRLPLGPVKELMLVAYEDRPDRFVRAIGGVVTFEERRILVASLHLKCCGRINSREDTKRLVEVGLVNRAIAAAMARAPVDAVIVGGDLNLVGGHRPIELLGVGIDLDGSDLEILEPYQLDGRSNATWTDAGLPFVPGRLDYLLVSDSALESAQTWIFASDDLPDHRLDSVAVTGADSSAASDHLPIVADLTWRGK